MGKAKREYSTRLKVEVLKAKDDYARILCWLEAHRDVQEITTSCSIRMELTISVRLCDQSWLVVTRQHSLAAIVEVAERLLLIEGRF